MKSAGDAFSSWKENHKEQFYYFAFIFDEGMCPYISAWSYEALEKSMMDNKITEEEKGWWKWDCSEYNRHCDYKFLESFHTFRKKWNHGYCRRKYCKY